MNFISIEFLIFFIVVIALYFLLSHRRQNIMLLFASYFFYGWWDWRFLSLILLSSVIDYFCGLAIDSGRNPHASQAKRRLVLIISMVSNLTILGFFKYWNFFSDSLVRIATMAGVNLPMFTLDVILPVGISFYTFQSMSYTIDIYRGEMSSTRRFFDFLLYVSFFPQLVAGPIERAKHLLPQVLTKREVNPERIESGIQLALWGFFKKMVIADNLAGIVSDIFSTPDSGALAIALGAYAFAFQIYCDFSGYTDIARGIARIMGFEICENFRLPYFAINPSDFWKRWHISLSSWLRDYLYIPLGGNKKGKLATYRNLTITMLLGGLWHGAAWHFVLWGAYQGLLLVVFRLYRELWPGNVQKSPKRGTVFWLKVILYFQLTCYGWIIFRVESLSYLATMTKSLLLNWSFEGLYSIHLIHFLLLTIPFICFQLYQFNSGKMEPWRNWGWLGKYVWFTILLLGIVLLGSPNVEQFIYFQF